MVTVSLKGPRSRVGLIARVDLVDVNTDVAVSLVGHMLADGATRIALVFYTDDEQAAQAAHTLMVEAAATEGVCVLQVWVVTETVFYPLHGPAMSPAARRGRAGRWRRRLLKLQAHRWAARGEPGRRHPGSPAPGPRILR